MADHMLRVDAAVQPAVPQAPATPELAQVPQAPVAGSDVPSPGRITVIRDGKTTVLDGAPNVDGLTTSSGFPLPMDIPPNVYMLAKDGIIGFTLMIIAFPVFGFLKSLVNLRPASKSALPSRDTTDRLQRIEAAVEAMSVEVERISEGQRFVTKVLAERSSAPQG